MSSVPGGRRTAKRRSASIIRPGGTLVSVVGPVEARPVDGLAVDFVVESVPSHLVEIVDRVWDGRLRTHIGTVATLDDAVPALNPPQRRTGKTLIRLRPLSAAPWATASSCRAVSLRAQRLTGRLA